MLDGKRFVYQNVPNNDREVTSSLARKLVIDVSFIFRLGLVYIRTKLFFACLAHTFGKRKTCSGSLGFNPKSSLELLLPLPPSQ